MTGQHQGCTRVRGNRSRGPEVAQALNGQDVTVARVLRDAGYATALVGKWGLGDAGASECGLPRRHGFDWFLGFLNQRHAHNHFPDFLWRNEERIALPNVQAKQEACGAGYSTNGVEYVDDRFADEVLARVRKHRDEPFFLFWSMVVPHANNERFSAHNDGAEVPDHGIYEGKDWTALFKTGDSVDLQLGADPRADPGRRGPVQGDLRLLLAPFQGKPVAVLYRHRAPGAADPVTFTSPWRSEKVDSVAIVNGAKIAVAKGADDYRVEAAIPLAALGLKPPGAFRADFGALYGDPSGTLTMLRSYWANQATGLVNDVPGEIMLHPNLWGTLKLEGAQE